MQLADLVRERRDRHRVLEQPAEIGVVAGAGARRPAPRGAQLAVAQQRRPAVHRSAGRRPRRRGARGSRRARRGRGRRRAGTAAGSTLVVRAATIAMSRPPGPARRGSARPGRARARGRRARSAPRARPPRGTRGRGSRPCGRAARAPDTASPVREIRRSLRVQANTPRTSSPGRSAADGLVPEPSAPMMYGEPDAAVAMGVPSRRSSGPGAGLRVQGLERRRGRRLDGHHVRRQRPRRAGGSRRSTPRTSTTSRRPGRRSSWSRARRAQIVWPDGRALRGPGAARAARPDPARPGSEPSFRWRTFSQLIVDLAEALGVQLVVTLGALLADVPHTRPVSVTGLASDPALVARLGLDVLDLRGADRDRRRAPRRLPGGRAALGEPVGRRAPLHRRHAQPEGRAGARPQARGARRRRRRRSELEQRPATTSARSTSPCRATPTSRRSSSGSSRPPARRRTTRPGRCRPARRSRATPALPAPARRRRAAGPAAAAPPGRKPAARTRGRRASPLGRRAHQPVVADRARRERRRRLEPLRQDPLGDLHRDGADPLGAVAVVERHASPSRRRARSSRPAARPRGSRPRARRPRTARAARRRRAGRRSSAGPSCSRSARTRRSGSRSTRSTRPRSRCGPSLNVNWRSNHTGSRLLGLEALVVAGQRRRGLAPQLALLLGVAEAAAPPAGVEQAQQLGQRPRRILAGVETLEHLVHDDPEALVDASAPAGSGTRARTCTSAGRSGRCRCPRPRARRRRRAGAGTAPATARRAPRSPRRGGGRRARRRAGSRRAPRR